MKATRPRKATGLLIPDPADERALLVARSVTPRTPPRSVTTSSQSHTPSEPGSARLKQKPQLMATNGRSSARPGSDHRSRGVQGTVRFRTTFRNTIYDVFRARGWRETESDTDWDVAWVDVGWIRDNMDAMHFDEHQRINHFRNHYELTRKDAMNRNLRRMQRQLMREERHDEACAQPPPASDDQSPHGHPTTSPSIILGTKV